MRALSLLALLLTACAVSVGQTDLTLKTRTTHSDAASPNVAGIRSETRTLYLKGAQQRMDTEWTAAGSNPNGMYNGAYSIIYDCTGKRMIRLNSRARTYDVRPFDSEVFEKKRAQIEADIKSGKLKPPAPDPNAPVLTIALDTNDTGERRTVGGFTLRHIVETETRELRGGDLRQNDARTERDGWYVDVPPPGSCGRAERRGYVGAVLSVSGPGGQRPRLEFKRTGNTQRRGIAVEETVRQTYWPPGVYTASATPAMRTEERTELIELSQAPIDPALFTIPKGYRQAQRLPRGGVNMEHAETLWGTIVAYWRDFWFRHRYGRQMTARASPSQR